MANWWEQDKVEGGGNEWWSADAVVQAEPAPVKAAPERAGILDTIGSYLTQALGSVGQRADEQDVGELLGEAQAQRSSPKPGWRSVLETQPRSPEAENVVSAKKAVAALPPEQRVQYLRQMAQDDGPLAGAASELVGQSMRQLAERDAVQNPAARAAANLPKKTGSAPPSDYLALPADVGTRMEDAFRTPQEIAKENLAIDGASGLNRTLVERAGDEKKRSAATAELEERNALAERRKFARENPGLAGLAVGSANVLTGTLNTPGVAADWLNQTAVNPVLQLVGLPPMERVPLALGTEYLQKAAAEYTPAIASMEPDDAWREGKFGAWSYAQIAIQAPQLAQLIAGGSIPALRKYVLAGMGAQAAGMSFAAGDDSRISAMKGGIEVVTEMLPFKAVDKVIDAIRVMPAASRGQLLRSVGQQVAKSAAVLTASVGANAIEESTAELGGNVLDKYVAGKNIGLMDGVAKAGTIGALTGTGFAAPGIVRSLQQQASGGDAAAALSAALDGGQFSQEGVDQSVLTQLRTESPTVYPAAPVPTPAQQARTASAQAQAASEQSMADIGAAATVDEAIAAASGAVEYKSRAVNLDTDALLSEAYEQAGIEEAALQAAMPAESVVPSVVAATDSVAETKTAAQPITWMGRSGTGYATPEAASVAQNERTKMRPSHEWTVAPTDNGRYMLTGLPVAVAQKDGGHSMSTTPELQTSYPTQEQAQAALVQTGIPESLAQVRPTEGGGFTIAPTQTQETIRELRDKSAAVQGLQAAIERGGEDASALQLYAPGRDSQNELAVGQPGRGAGGAGAMDVGQQVAEIGRAAEVAFGWRPVAVTGLPASYGVQYQGRVFIDVDSLSVSAPSGNTVQAMVVQTVGHETTHNLEKSQDPQDKADYAVLRQAVLGNARPERVASRVQAEGQGQTYGENEIVADVSGAFWLDPKFWGRLYDLDSAVMRRIAYKFMEHAAKLTKVVKGSRLDAGRFLKDGTVEQVREIAAQVWASRAQRGEPLFSRSTTEAPSGQSRANFEVAPDPNDAELSARWGALPLERKLDASREVAGTTVPQVLDLFGAAGTVTEQTGSYLADTNPSFALQLSSGDLQAVSMGLGYVLSQDSMMNLSAVPFAGSEPVGAVLVDVGGLDFEGIKALYEELRTGIPEVGGQSTTAGVMTILNYSDLTTDALTAKVDEIVGERYDVRATEAHSSFPEKQDYDYDNQANDPRVPGKVGEVARRRLRDLRREASQAINRGIERPSGSSASAERGDGSGRPAPGSLEAGQNAAPKRAADGRLEGAPSVKGFSGPDPRLVSVAEQYARSIGLKLKPQAEYAKVDPERAARIADAYGQMEHAPQDPAVKAAYDNLIRQTTAQYRALEKAGYKFWFIDIETAAGQDYASTPWNAMRDIRANQRMGIFPNAEGFGSSDLDVSSNPLLQDTGITWPAGSPDGQPKQVLANDLFRAVHDAFGHGLEGAGFRADGEENAWQAHVRLFTGSAVGAITSETRGQNSWLNFGPNGETNRTAAVEDTVFADQKTGLMPEWTWTEGRVGDGTNTQRKDDGSEQKTEQDRAGSNAPASGKPDGVQDGRGRPDAQRSSPGGSIVERSVPQAGRPRYGTAREGSARAVGVHFSKQVRQELDSSFYGTGMKGEEARRLEGENDIRPRVFFYVDVGNGVSPESNVGGYAHDVQLDNLYDLSQDTLRLVRDTRGMAEAERANAWERAIMQAGFDGYLRTTDNGLAFAVLVGAHKVPVAPAAPRIKGRDGVAAKPAASGPKAEVTRAVKDELVRRPVGAEVMQVIAARKAGLSLAAPSFKMEFGEARVLASEAAVADAVLADHPGGFAFGEAPSRSSINIEDYDLGDPTDYDFDVAGEYDESATFANLEIDESLLDEPLSFLDDDATLRAQLQEELEATRQPARRAQIEQGPVMPSAQAIKDAGLHAEDAFEEQPKIVDGPRKASATLPAHVSDLVTVEVMGDPNRRRAYFNAGPFSVFTNVRTLTDAQLEAYLGRQMAGMALQESGHDIASAYRKGTILKIAQGWKGVASMAGAFKLPKAGTSSTQFVEVAQDMLAFEGYDVRETANDHDRGTTVEFTRKSDGAVWSAEINSSGKELQCCTMDLAGSGGLGTEFYAVLGRVAENRGKTFKADEFLSGINSYRRTEQALSYALKSGKTDVMLPGLQNRVYGYDTAPKTTEAHDRNLARLALASLRNVEELVPDVHRLRYLPESDTFVDAKGADQAEAVKKILAGQEARAFGLGRSTLARAALTRQMIDGRAIEGKRFAAPVAYSLAGAELDAPMAEAWGTAESGLDSLNPNLRRFIAGSAIVDAQGMPVQMYHGTAQDIRAFRPKQSGAVFLTYEPRFAEDFAGLSKDWMMANWSEVLTPQQQAQVAKQAAKDVMAEKGTPMTERRKISAAIKAGETDGMAQDYLAAAAELFLPSGENILPVFVRATTPFDYRNKSDVDALVFTLWDRAGLDEGDALELELVKKGRDKSTVTQDELARHIRGGAWEYIEAPMVQDALRQDLGHDGFFVKENGQINLAVYDPAAVKSVFNSTYDTGTSDLSLSRVGAEKGGRADLEGYMRQRNKKMPTISSASEQEADIALAVQAIEAASQEIEDGSRDSVPIPLGRTPHVLNMLGARSKMLRIDTGILRKVLFDKHSEDFVGVTVERLLRAIYDPAMVLKGREIGGYEVVTDIITKNGPILVPVIDGGESFAVMSAYAKNVGGAGESLLKRINGGALLYADPARAQSAMTGRDSTPARGINALGQQFPRTPPLGAQPVGGNAAEFDERIQGIITSGAQFPSAPPRRAQDGSLPDRATSVKPLNPYYVGWDKVRDAIVGGIQSRKVKSDIDLAKRIGNLYKGEWEDAPSFSRAPQTEAFKAWFGDSKVVDAKGEPLRMYHGTSKDGDFSSFKVGARGAWFTSDPEVASEYSEENDSQGSPYNPDTRRYDPINTASRVLPVYLSISNPYRLTAADAQRVNVGNYAKAQSALFAEIRAKGYDGILWNDNLTKEWVVLGRPSQIKSATGNRGTFDPAKNNLSFSRTPRQGDRFLLPAESGSRQFRRKVQDYFLRVRDVQEAVAAQGGVLTEQTNVYDAEALSHGRATAQLQDFAMDQVQPLLEKTTKMGVQMDELSLYAYAMHATERNAQIAKIDPRTPDGGSGMTNADAAGILQLVQLSGDQAKFTELHADLMAITQTNRLVMLDEGLMTQQEFDALDGMYEHYIPLRGFELVDEDNKPTGRSPGRGFNIRGSETVRALGRKTRAGQLVENVIGDYQRTTVRAERNQVAKVFLNFVLHNPDSKLWEIDATSTRKSLDRQTGRVARNTAIEKGEDTIAVKVKGREIYIQIKDPLLARAMRKSHADETGEIASDLMRTSGLYTSLLRNTLTRYNPEFAVVNTIRDFGFGSVAVLDALGEKGVAKFVAHYAGATAASARAERRTGDPQAREWDRWFAEYRAAGGVTGGFYQKGVEEITGDIRAMMLEAGAAPKDWQERVRYNKATSLAKSALRVLEFAGSVSENAARVSAYRTAREMGQTRAQAALLAKGLTTNFDRKGEYGQLLNSLYVFFNAAIQGSHKTLQMLKNPKVQGYMAGLGAASVALAFANATAGGDDPDDGMAYWDKIPDYVKERNLIIMLPAGMQVEGAEEVGTKGRYLTIPMQYGLNIPHVVGYAVADVYRNLQDKTRGTDIKEAGLRLASAVAGSFNPFDGSIDLTNPSSMAQAVTPSVFDPVVQMATGTNSFGRDVAPFKSPFDSKPDSYNANLAQTGSPAAKVAQWLNSATGGSSYESGGIDVSPGAIENMVRNTTGGTGMFLYDTVSLAGNAIERYTGGDPDLFIRQIPMARRVYGETAGDIDQGLFYDRRQKIQKAVAVEKGAAEADVEITDPEKMALASLGKDAGKYTKWLSDIRKDMKELQADEAMAKGDKRLKMRELRAERDRLTADFNKDFMDTMREAFAGSQD